MQAVTIVQITPQELETIIEKCLAKALLVYAETLKVKDEIDHWFDLKEICDYIPGKLAPPTVYGLVSQKRIPFHKQGKKLYFLKSEIDSWLKEGKGKIK